MKLFSTSKLSRKKLENLALAGSLLLHVGFIVLFSLWPEVLETPPKKQPKMVKVKILFASAAHKDAQRSVPEIAALQSPAQPETISSSSIPTLTARTPRSSIPASLPESRAKQTMKPQKTHYKPRKIQRISISSEAIKTARSTKATQQSHSHRKTITVRPLPTSNAFPMKSAQPLQTVGYREPSQRTVTPRKPLPRPDTFTIVPTAFPRGSSERKLTPIQQRPIPKPSQNIFSTEASSTSRKTVQSSASSLKPETQIASLPQSPLQSTTTVLGDLEANLSAVRGLFAGKVRQQIANVKHYPRIARRRGMEGQPVVAFTLNKRGGIMKANLAQTSGYRLLDRAALDAVQQAAPYPEIPAELKTDTYHFKLPVSFILK